MKEKSGSGEINAEVKSLPKMAAQPKANIRSDDHKGEEVKGNSADRVFKRLAGRVDRVDEVAYAKARVFVQKQDGRMQQRYRETNVTRPIVQPKIIEPVMRPGAMRAVTKRHEHS